MERLAELSFASYYYQAHITFEFVINIDYITSQIYDNFSI